jgi:hypothetical protein
MWRNSGRIHADSSSTYTLVYQVFGSINMCLWRERDLWDGKKFIFMEIIFTVDLITWHFSDIIYTRQKRHREVNSQHGEFILTLFYYLLDKFAMKLSFTVNKSRYRIEHIVLGMWTKAEGNSLKKTQRINPLEWKNTQEESSQARREDGKSFLMQSRLDWSDVPLLSSSCSTLISLFINKTKDVD